jgi:hypothetical protein
MKPVPRWFVILCGVLAVGFSMCVGLQVNDPDPAVWMTLYAAAAIAIAVLPVRRMFTIGAVAVGLVAIGWGTYLGRQVVGELAPSDLWLKMSEKGGAVEVGREAVGLLIVAVALLGTAAFRATRA